MEFSSPRPPVRGTTAATVGWRFLCAARVIINPDLPSAIQDGWQRDGGLGVGGRIRFSPDPPPSECMKGQTGALTQKKKKKKKVKGYGGGIRVEQEPRHFKSQQIRAPGVGGERHTPIYIARRPFSSSPPPPTRGVGRTFVVKARPRSRISDTPGLMYSTVEGKKKKKFGDFFLFLSLHQSPRRRLGRKDIFIFKVTFFFFFFKLFLSRFPLFFTSMSYIHIYRLGTTSKHLRIGFFILFLSPLFRPLMVSIRIVDALK